MLDRLVVALNLGEGIYQEFRGLKAPIWGLQTDEIPDSGEEVDHVLRKVQIWACEQRDVDVVVDRMSAAWVGHEIKVFNLSAITVRLPGELKSKQITKDGILPV